MKSSEATPDDELLALERGLQRARDRARRNGLTLEFGDHAAGAVWPGKRYASAALMDGEKMIASFTQSYSDEASRQRALSSCAERVYIRPDGVD